MTEKQGAVSVTQIPLTDEQRKALSVDRHVVIGAAPEAKQEPVAWRTFDGEGGYDYRTYDDNENYAEEWAKRNPKHIGWVEPLYIHPAPVNQQLLEKAKAVVDRWETPLWKDVPATAIYIYELRNAIAAVEGKV